MNGRGQCERRGAVIGSTERTLGAAVRGLAVGLALLVGGALPAQAAGTATDSVKHTVDEVVRILQDKEMKKPDRTDERRRLLEKVIGDRFDYDEMAKRTLTTQWAKLNRDEQQEFVVLFRRLLSNTYADKIEGYSGEPVQYLNERQQEGFAEVKTKVISGKAEIPLDYRLMHKSDNWRVYDVVVDGVSLVNNYRGQFTKVIHSSSYADLVEKLRKKSDKFVAQ
ncbi:MAG: ABC transporter substrate-binding protein [Nitrospirae bacterium]|nr:MAG: ABC transporter substrate-binding protein [Nitrospirota bacterium]